MDIITQETRHEAYIKKPNHRQTLVLEVLGNEVLTAREIAQKLGYTDLNMVRPRITELLQVGKIETVGKRTDKLTERKVAMFRKVERE